MHMVRHDKFWAVNDWIETINKKILYLSRKKNRGSETTWKSFYLRRVKKEKNIRASMKFGINCKSHGFHNCIHATKVCSSYTIDCKFV